VLQCVAVFFSVLQFAELMSLLQITTQLQMQHEHDRTSATEMVCMYVCVCVCVCVCMCVHACMCGVWCAACGVRCVYESVHSYTRGVCERVYTVIACQYNYVSCV